MSPALMFILLSTALTDPTAEQEQEQERAKRREVNEFGVHERPWAQDVLAGTTAGGDDPIAVTLEPGLEQAAERTEQGLGGAAFPAAMRRTIAETAASLRAIRTEERALARRSQELDERALAVDVVERRAREEIERLSLLKREIEGLIDELERREGENVAYVASLVENMSAKDGARLLAGNGDLFIVDVLAKLDERQAAEILSRMEDDRAADIMKRLSERGRPGREEGQPAG